MLNTAVYKATPKIQHCLCEAAATMPVNLDTRGWYTIQDKKNIVQIQNASDLHKSPQNYILFYFERSSSGLEGVRQTLNWTKSLKKSAPKGYWLQRTTFWEPWCACQCLKDSCGGSWEMGKKSWGFFWFGLVWFGFFCFGLDWGFSGVLLLLLLFCFVV